MFGYVNTRGTRNLTVFQVNATGGGRQEQASGGSPQPGGNYHMHYEYDLEEDTVFYRITTAGGSTVVVPRLRPARHDLLDQPLLHRVRLPARRRGPGGLHPGLDLLQPRGGLHPLKRLAA